MSENRNKSSNFVDFVVEVERVTKVTKGGKNFSFAALVVTGDQAGNVGIALGKSREVSLAIAKATSKARRNLIKIPLRGTTIPYDIKGSHGASNVVIRPAYKGTGIIAGGAMRPLFLAAGVKDVIAKSVGASNRTNVIKAALNALAQLRTATEMARLRGKTIEEMIGSSN
jgi:small subunit ribosomal protein S5